MKPETPPVYNGISGLTDTTGGSGQTGQTQTQRGLQPDGMSSPNPEYWWYRRFCQFNHFVCVPSLDAATSKNGKPDANVAPGVQP